MEYSIWSACERFGIQPPGIKSSWSEMEEDPISQSLIIAFNQIREIEDFDVQAALAGAKI